MTVQIPISRGLSEDGTIRMFQSTLIRRGVALGVLGVLTILRAAGVHPVIFGVNLASWNVDAVADALMGFGALAFATYSIKKRIRDGKDPANPAPPIKAPAVVEAVQRLSRS